MKKKLNRKLAEVEFIEFSKEEWPGVNIGWQRAQTIVRAYGFAPFIIEAFKPILLSVYMQGCYDGYGAAQHEGKEDEKEIERLKGLEIWRWADRAER